MLNLTEQTEPRKMNSFRKLLHKALKRGASALPNRNENIKKAAEINPRKFPVYRSILIDGKEYRLKGDSYLENMSYVYEPGLSTILGRAAAVAGTGIALDVGANIGATAILLSRLMSEVACFEASPRTFSILKENLDANKINNTYAYPWGLGASDEELSITAAFDNASGGFISPSIQNLGGHLTEVAQIKNGDKIMDECHPSKRVALIKIDVEGHELEVLEGLSNRIKKDKPIIVLEMNHWCLNAFKKCSLPDFLERVAKTYPHILAWDDSSQNSHLIGSEYPDNTYHVMHEHIVKNRYPTLVIAPTAEMLAFIGE